MLSPANRRTGISSHITEAHFTLSGKNNQYVGQRGSSVDVPQRILISDHCAQLLRTHLASIGGLKASTFSPLPPLTSPPSRLFPSFCALIRLSLSHRRQICNSVGISEQCSIREIRQHAAATHRQALWSNTRVSIGERGSPCDAAVRSSQTPRAVTWI